MLNLWTFRPLLWPRCNVVFSHPTGLSSILVRSVLSFSIPSVALPASQLSLQPFRFFTYVTAHSPTLLLLLLRHRLFTYATWRAAHDRNSKGSTSRLQVDLSCFETMVFKFIHLKIVIIRS